MPIRKIRLITRQCPGDALVATAAVKALHVSQPNAFITDYQGFYRELFENSPYITPLQQWEGREVVMDYGYGIQGEFGGGGAGRLYHFMHAYVENLSKQLGVHIELRDAWPDVHLTEAERLPLPGLPERGYIVIDAGRKADFTAKHFSEWRYQEVVNALRNQFTFVQIGADGDHHPPLRNAINLVGKTTIRQLMQVVYNSALVLTPVSFPMHLAAAVPMPDNSKRPCVVVAGSREPRQWEQYAGHVWLGGTGKLPCGIRNGDACWKTKVVRDGPDDNICTAPTDDGHGQIVPACLERITSRQIVDAIVSYF